MKENKQYEWKIDEDSKPSLFGENITYEDVNKRVEDMSKEDRAIHEGYKKMGEAILKMWELKSECNMKVSKLFFDIIAKSKSKQQE